MRPHCGATATSKSRVNLWAPLRAASSGDPTAPYRVAFCLQASARRQRRPAFVRTKCQWRHSRRRACALIRGKKRTRFCIGGVLCMCASIGHACALSRARHGCLRCPCCVPCVWLFGLGCLPSQYARAHAHVRFHRAIRVSTRWAAHRQQWSSKRHRVYPLVPSEWMRLFLMLPFSLFNCARAAD